MGRASGVYGVVGAGPTCPVERVDQPCPPRPVSAEVEARTRDARLVAKAASANNGRYDLALTPGVYILTVVTSGLPRCPPVMITVKSGAATHANITCDTGSLIPAACVEPEKGLEPLASSIRGDARSCGARKLDRRVELRLRASKTGRRPDPQSRSVTPAHFT
jgi:hypothetical protein